ncbi:hypothetical protein ABE504_27895 [Paenibacillus oryzisoli]|uniref:hypothetical protein n=1 Tax=Paenibacillus oryzisoli TaxID=1850517 RepID=UPI003D2E0871
MINAYPPIQAVSSYQTHKDYYRVSAVSRTAGGQSSTIRRAMDLPYEKLPYKHYAQTAAKSVSNVLASAQNVQQSAATLVRAGDERQPETNRDIQETVHHFIDSYNDLQDELGQAGGEVSHALLRGLERAAQPYLLGDIGITEQEDGKLTLEPELLEAGRDAALRADAGSAISRVTSFAASMAKRLDQLQQMPAAALLQLSASPLKPYGQYRAKLDAYLPVPLRGMLLDARM